VKMGATRSKFTSAIEKEYRRPGYLSFHVLRHLCVLLQTRSLTGELTQLNETPLKSDEPPSRRDRFERPRHSPSSP